MISINNNDKLADLIEKLLEPKEVTSIDLIDANDLIIELRSNHGEVILTDPSSCNNHHY